MPNLQSDPTPSAAETAAAPATITPAGAVEAAISGALDAVLGPDGTLDYETGAAALGALAARSGIADARIVVTAPERAGYAHLPHAVEHVIHGAARDLQPGALTPFVSCVQYDVEHSAPIEAEVFAGGMLAVSHEAERSIEPCADALWFGLQRLALLQLLAVGAVEADLGKSEPT